jgi:hypothetical protein
VALSRTGHRPGAAAMAQHALTAAAPPQDPWLFYGQGDFRHWPALLAGLRGDAR